MLQWLFFFGRYSLEPNIATVRFWARHGGMDDDKRALVELKRRQGHAALAVMETHVASRRFFVGEAFTIADIALYAYAHVAHQGGFDLTPYPAVRAWLDRCATEPGHVTMSDA